LHPVELVAVGAVGLLVLVLVVVLALRLRGGSDGFSGYPVGEPPSGGGHAPPAADAPRRQATGRAGRPKDRRWGVSFGWQGSTGRLGPGGLMSGGLAPGGLAPGGLRDLVASVQEAMADGELTDEELGRLFPGAKVVRNGDAVTVEHTSGWGSLDWDAGRDHHHVEWQAGPAHRATWIEVDGTRVSDPSEITDPEVRARVEQALRDLGT
jgi:hypothetical protein